MSLTAVGDAALLGLQAASDFAGTVEEASRVVEYLQLVAAAAVDRTRKQSAATAAKRASSWTTGWRETTRSPATAAATAFPAGPADSADSAGWIGDAGSPRPGDSAGWIGDAGSAGWIGDAGSPRPADSAGDAGAAGFAADVGCGVDDGYRNTGEFLRARLRISAAEARRRLSLSGDLLPRQGFTSEPLPAVHAELGAAVAAGNIASRPAGTISLALDRVRHLCDTDTRDRMEHALTQTAAENDPDFLARVARSWVDAIDQDGAEPSEELLRQLQGVFLRKPRHGLEHLEIFATTEQFEHLLTVMNTATNPRTPPTPPTTTAPAGSVGSTLDWALPGTSTSPGDGACDGGSDGGSDGACDGGRGGGVVLDLRSRPQKHLDGLVGACKVALTTGLLPATGGLRPQVMVTIDYRDLLARLRRTDETGNGPEPLNDTETDNSSEPLNGTEPLNGSESRNGTACGKGSLSGGTAAHTGAMLFTGPVTASTARKIACDADIIPVLLGSEGRVLDIGRATRIFPPHIRKALTARDQGCAFPGCTIPAPWCEAHHITYWSRGGTTGTDNGVLLCSHHHHIIHKEHWTIHLRTGIPWFIPPPHVDPRQKPQRNHYFHPTHLNTAS
ncbi:MULTISPECIES: HNH endonuclease [unclassified Arthrobacter]|uniref:HNH endonuclease n=1 Tax=unclassified Arthrobacter TaxID=235627 RepID=UPI002E15FE20